MKESSEARAADRQRLLAAEFTDDQISLIESLAQSRAPDSLRVAAEAYGITEAEALRLLEETETLDAPDPSI